MFVICYFAKKLLSLQQVKFYSRKFEDFFANIQIFRQLFAKIGKFLLHYRNFSLILAKIIAFMAGQFPFSNASGQVILKGILEKLQITISQLEKETGLSYSSLQRIFNGETKKITIPVYTALKEWQPKLRDEYLRDAQLPIFDTDEENEEEPEDDINIISILNNARQILEMARDKEQRLKDIEDRLEARSKELDKRASELDAIMKMIVTKQISESTPETQE